MIFTTTSTYEQDQARKRLEKLIDKGATVEILEKRERRSRRQNAYFHAILSIYAMETGYTPDEAKTVIKRACGLVYEKNGEKFLRSTASLDTKEMAKFTEDFRNLAATQDIYLHSPEEYERNWASIDRWIKQQKERQ